MTSAELLDDVSVIPEEEALRDIVCVAINKLP